LNTHISDVVTLIQSERLTNVVLVGHSYSGMVVVGVADRIAGQLASLVYVDALVPENGQSYFDLADSALVEYLTQAADGHAESWKIPVVLTAEMAGVTGPKAVQFNTRTVPHPLRTMEEPISLVGDATPVPVTYIACTNPWSGAPYMEQARKARRLGWTVCELPTGHLPMITMPEELCSLLIQAAK
jgi:pimeloyl-ACP methyl ester carboxylesterase